MRDGDVKVAARVIDARLGEAGTGNPQLGIQFQTDNAEVGTVTAYLFFSDATLERTEKALTDLGWAPAANDWDLETMLADRLLIGVECSLVVAEEEYNGRFGWKVKFINAAGGMMKKTYDENEVASFAQKFRAKMRGQGVPVKEPAPTRRPATPASRNVMPGPTTRAPSPRQAYTHDPVPGVDTDADGIPF